MIIPFDGLVTLLKGLYLFTISLSHTSQYCQEAGATVPAGEREQPSRFCVRLVSVQWRKRGMNARCSQDVRGYGPGIAVVRSVLQIKVFPDRQQNWVERKQLVSFWQFRRSISRLGVLTAKFFTVKLGCWNTHCTK